MKRKVGTFRLFDSPLSLLLCLMAWIGLTVGAAGTARAQPGNALGPSDVLVLVNGDSPVSVSIANRYGDYRTIPESQILTLSGLPDCASATAGPADEIITRTQFETLIAQPVRDYLTGTGLVDSIYCLITTAGMPYRIEDTDPELADVVKPAGSDPMLTVANRYRVNAASVESELSVLFQIDPALPSPPGFQIENRLVNPYQGYLSGIKSWSGIRDILTRRQTLRWTYLWRVSQSPRIEGEFNMGGYSSANRIMSPADIYLVARLDGPRAQGEFPIFSVENMLHRSAMVSDPSAAYFTGHGSGTAAAVIDEAPNGNQLAFTKILNFPPQYDSLDFATHPAPPGAEEFGRQFNSGNHFIRAFEHLTQLSPPAGVITSQPVVIGLGGEAVFDDTNAIMNSNFLSPGIGLMGLLTYGRNGGDGRPADYLLTSGPSGGPLFECSPGAVFASLESYNAVTMFTDASTGQGKIADFITMGGTAAVGHSFEPEVGATIQGEFLLRNLLRDDDGDGVGDLTLVEAVFSAMPYLSWSEVLIGDPLMRIRSGPGGIVNLEPCPGDVNGNGLTDVHDLLELLEAWDSSIGDPKYNPAADSDGNGSVDFFDFLAFMQDLGDECSSG